MAKSVAVGTTIGGGFGTLVAVGCAVSTDGLCILTGPQIIISWAGLGGSVGGAVGIILQATSGSEAGPEGSASGGAKSRKEYDRHVGEIAEAKGELEALKRQLQKAKGPKARRPLEDAIRKKQDSIKGLEKEFKQKWKEGRPEQ